MVRTWARQAVAAVRREWQLLSSGQRWTAGLAFVVCASLLAFGLPSEVGVGGGRPAAAAALGSPTTPRAAAPSAALPLGNSEDATPSAAGPVDAPSAPTSTPRSPATDRPDVVLIAAPPGPLPGPSDADVARVFRDSAGVEADLLVMDPNSDAPCALGLEPGTIVVTSLGLGPTARTCLVDRGVIVLGYDAFGETGPTPAGGRSLSTSRGEVQSLLDLTRWGRATGRLVGTVVLEDGPASEAQATTGARDFTTAGVDTVILAATADHQRTWALRAALLAPNVRHLVSDLAGALLDETRPPTFAGAQAHTASRVPWFSRDHGPTAAQQRCTTTWTEGAPATPELAPVEQHRVFAWCQHLQLVTHALGAAGSAVDAIRQSVFDSPLTSDLGPQADGTWGPGLDAVLAYDAACGCWTEADPFAPRSQEDR